MTSKMTFGKLGGTTLPVPIRESLMPSGRETELSHAFETLSPPPLRARLHRGHRTPPTLMDGTSLCCQKMDAILPLKVSHHRGALNPIVMMNAAQTAADEERRRADAGAQPPTEPKAMPTSTGGGSASATVALQSHLLSQDLLNQNRLLIG